MNSLSQLQEYGSSESEEDLPVHESRRRLPPPDLPNFKEYLSITRQPVLQKENEGKIRNFPHEPGNWTTYIYVNIDSSSHVTDFLRSLLNSLSVMELHKVEDFHISVTRTLVLRHHWIQDFVDSVYVNEQKTRTFIGLKVRQGSRELSQIVEVLDRCLASYNLQPFYKSHSFHMSLLWCSGDKKKEIITHLKSLPECFWTFTFYNQVNGLKCNSGNKTFSFSFSNTR